VGWRLRFEYSNPFIEPVCYCVKYAGNVPWDCDTRELAALDEGHQQFEVSLRTFSYGGYDCPASGTVNIFSYPSGALIPQPTWTFAGMGEEWHTIEVPVGPGSFLADETFLLLAYVDYTDPEYPDRWLTEEVIVAPNGQHLWIRDAGGECAAGGGDNVPPVMGLGQSECFRVCHRVYHVALAATDPLNPPQVTITPGCFGPPQDLCAPDPACTPGGPFDYRWRVWWAGGSWEFEFEYSNENIEPVCYCVTVGTVPCLPVTDLVIQWPDSVTNNVRLGWTCPQWGEYIIYSTTAKNNDGNPPGIGWTEEGRVMGNAGQVLTWQPVSGIGAVYRNYVIKCNCDPSPGLK
jgi:hypothetical protein